MFPLSPLKTSGDPACATACRRAAVDLLRHGLWLVLAITGGSRVYALDPARKPDTYSIYAWSIDRGLPSDKVRAVTQTRDGYLWIATAQGLARFDGHDFTNFTGATNAELRGGGFFAVQEAPDGTLWAGGDNGLFRWRNGGFDRLTTADGLPSNYVRALTLTHDGALVVCTRGGFSFVRNGRIETPEGVWKQTRGVTRSYTEEPDGAQLLGTDEGLWRLRGNTIKRISGHEGLPNRGFVALTTAPDGTVWIGHSAGVRRIARDGTVTDFGPSQGLANPRVAALRLDRDGNAWIATPDGLYRLTRDRIAPARYPAAGLVGSTVQNIFEDREGALWIAAAPGLFRLEDNIATTVGTSEGLAQNAVYAVREAHDGAWWIGLWNGGVFRYDRTRAVRVSVDGSPAPDQVLALCEADDGSAMWIGAMTGLYRYTAERTEHFYRPEQNAGWLELLAHDPNATIPGIAHNRVNCITNDGAGGIWVGTDGALYHGDESGGFRSYTTAQGLPGNVIKSVWRARNGDVWITAPPFGVARLHGGKWIAYAAGRELSPIYPRTLFEDRTGAIWATTDGGGINRFRDDKWRVFTARDGLVDDFISGIVEDKSGNLWLAFPRGVMRLMRDQLDAFDAGTIATLRPRVFGRSDGLPAGEPNQQGSPNAWRARDGRLLFATDRGVGVVEPDHLTGNAAPPPVYVERLMINGTAADLSRPVVVPPGSNDVEIHYTAIETLAPENVRFRIRLSPLDQQWVEMGARRDVRYAKLPPGRYRFSVIATDNTGVWSDAGAAIAFDVQPFFYETRWFAALAIAAVIAAVGFVFWLRSRLTRRRMRMLQQLVDERTRALEEINKKLVETSRLAGMAEVATGVLHNVGNVLNSVNVSATVLTDLVRGSKVDRVAKLSELLQEHAANFPEFVANDPRGQRIPAFLLALGDHLAQERASMLKEIDGLQRNVDHIKQVVMMQQSYARVAGVIENTSVVELVEDAIKINAAALERHGIQLEREYAAQPIIATERHRVIQILVNLIRNAKFACQDSGKAERRVRVRIEQLPGRVRIAVTDNGVGIPPENLTRIFAHGFTTRRDGHGFGLHSGSLAARELGGSLSAQSEGLGCGATFTLELPERREQKVV